MLSFRQYINLLEANIGRFAMHIPGFDPTNPEHKDLHAAYEKIKILPDGRPKPPPKKIKSLDDLKAMVKPVSDEMQKDKVKETDNQKQTKESLESGRTIVLHHDPKTGVSVTQFSEKEDAMNPDPNNPAKCPGSLCIAKEGPHEISDYDPEKTRTFKFEFPNAKNPDHKVIVSSNCKNEEDTKTANGRDRGNFRDLNNKTVSKKDWDELIKGNKLNKIQALKGVVRGIPISKEEKEEYKNKLTNDIKNKTAKPEHIIHAINNDYITPEHINDIVNNHNTKPKVLESIASHTKDPNIHEKLLNHPKIDEYGLDTIAKKNPSLHEQILNHPKVGAAALNTIANDNPELHEQILKHPKVDGETLNTIANDSPELHEQILKHPKVGDHALSTIADMNPQLHERILKHPNVGEDTLNSIAHGSPKLHKQILNHPKVGEDALSTIARKSPELHKQILNHPKVESAALREIAYDSPELHAAIAAHPKTSSDTLNLIAQKSSDPKVQELIKKHHNYEK